MFQRKSKQQNEQQEAFLSQSELLNLKEAFADLSVRPSSKTQTSKLQYDISDVQQAPKSSLQIGLSKIKTYFLWLNSRSFSKYAQFASMLELGDQIPKRPQLLKVNLTVGCLQVVTLCSAIFIPRGLIYKSLFTLATLIVHCQVVEKIMLNYYVQKFALSNNRMQPIEQQARNLIQYKYKIHHQSMVGKTTQISLEDPYVKDILQKVENKNQEYRRFKKVQALL